MPEPEDITQSRTVAQSTDQTAQPQQHDQEGQSPTTEADSTSNGVDSEELSRDHLFDALKNSRRRQLIRYLDQRGEQVSLGTIAEHVAAIENDTKPRLLDSDQRKRVYVALYQGHLPRLDAMDVVDFDQSRGHVELGAAAPQLTRYLYLDDARDRPSYRYYLVFFGMVALVLATGAATGLVGAVTAASVFLGFVLGVVGVALVQVVGRQH